MKNDPRVKDFPFPIVPHWVQIFISSPPTQYRGFFDGEPVHQEWCDTFDLHLYGFHIAPSLDELDSVRVYNAGGIPINRDSGRGIPHSYVPLQPSSLKGTFHP